MHGLGNDFVVIDAREMDIKPIKKNAAWIGDRRFGVGCDQLLLLRKSNKADFRMQIFNSDGSEVEMCGNGIRCLAKFLQEKKITRKNEIRFETLAGTIITRFQGKEVEVDMGAPILEAPEIPVNLKGRVANHKVKVLGRGFEITCVSMGNPHCVIFVKNLDSFDLAKFGPAFETHKLFPNRINVEFVEVVSKKQLRMKVWERGAGETLACGTGACAVAVASKIVQGTGKSVTVKLAGGNLKIRWNGENEPVFMCGPANTVYNGVMELG